MDCSPYRYNWKRSDRSVCKGATKEAAELDFDDSLPLSFTEVKKEIKNDTTVKWQRQWD